MRTEMTDVGLGAAVMTTDHRAMTVDEDTLVSIVDAIDAAVSPLEIILFGSQARGDARPDSDLDLLVVVPDGTSTMEITKRAHSALRLADRHLAGVDVLVVTPELRRRKMLVRSSVITHAMHDGVLLRRAGGVPA